MYYKRTQKIYLQQPFYYIDLNEKKNHIYSRIAPALQKAYLKLLFMKAFIVEISYTSK